MRLITILAAGAAAIAMPLASAAQTQPSQTAPARPPATAPQAPASPPAIKSVSVVDISELPESTQNQVNQIVAQRGEGELRKLQSAVEAAPNLKSALQAKGASATQVVLAQINDDGELTLVTKKAG